MKKTPPPPRRATLVPARTQATVWLFSTVWVAVGVAVTAAPGAFGGAAAQPAEATGWPGGGFTADSVACWATLCPETGGSVSALSPAAGGVSFLAVALPGGAGGTGSLAMPFGLASRVFFSLARSSSISLMAFSMAALIFGSGFSRRYAL